MGLCHLVGSWLTMANICLQIVFFFRVVNFFLVKGGFKPSQLEQGPSWVWAQLDWSVNNDFGEEDKSPNKKNNRKRWKRRITRKNVREEKSLKKKSYDAMTLASPWTWVELSSWIFSSSLAYSSRTWIWVEVSSIWIYPYLLHLQKLNYFPINSTYD